MNLSNYHQKLKGKEKKKKNNKKQPNLYSSVLMAVTVISAYFNRCSVYKTANGFRVMNKVRRPWRCFFV